MTRALAVERFWARVDRGDDSGCWLWIGPLQSMGYGTIMVGGRATLAHRYSYQLTGATIPESLSLDHLCRVRRCVRPDHLEAVTLGTNVLRGESPWARNARKTACPSGHPYDKRNNRGARVCSECERTAKRLRDRRRRLRLGMIPRRSEEAS